MIYVFKNRLYQNQLKSHDFFLTISQNKLKMSHGKDF